MQIFELLVAVACAALGARSLVHWLRVPIALERPKHHVLFALFVVARVGAWWSMAALFAIFGTRGTIGRAFTDDVAPYRGLAVVPVVLVVLSVAASAALAVGRDDDEPDGVRSDEPDED